MFDDKSAYLILSTYLPNLVEKINIITNQILNV